jgi:ABC-type uncharacterized transport system involved in gliding motility auxiliary subunit
VSQQRGFMQISQPVHYPFALMPKALNAHHALTRGLTGVAFPFMSPLTLSLPSDSAVKGEVLVASSANGWIQSPPYNLDPMQRWTADQVKDQGVKPLMISLAGPVKSPYAATSGDAHNARILVSGGYAFLTDEFLNKSNEALALNLFDWLVQDDGLLAVRTRGLAAAPIDDKISDTSRNALKYMNILGLPLAFVGFGLIRWRMREGRRSKATL